MYAIRADWEELGQLVSELVLELVTACLRADWVERGQLVWERSSPPRPLLARAPHNSWKSSCIDTFGNSLFSLGPALTWMSVKLKGVAQGTSLVTYIYMGTTLYETTLYETHYPVEMQMCSFPAFVPPWIGGTTEDVEVGAEGLPLLQGVGKVLEQCLRQEQSGLEKVGFKTEKWKQNRKVLTMPPRHEKVPIIRRGMILLIAPWLK